MIKDIWVDIKTASQITGLHPHTIRKYIKMGIFEINRPFIKEGSKIMVSKDSLVRKYSLPAYSRKGNKELLRNINSKQIKNIRLVS